MVIRPWQLHAVRRGPLTVRYAELGLVIYAVVESIGSQTTIPLEDWCLEPHWGLMRSGDLELESEPGDRRVLSAGEAFYVPAHPPHRFLAPGDFVAAGFAPLQTAPLDDAAAAQAGFETIDGSLLAPLEAVEQVSFPAQPTVRSVAEGRIEVDSLIMGPWVCSSVRFGRKSGFVSSWCDLPHWGTVLDGSLAIETESTTEFVSRGDAFAVTAGPPGHRLEVTDGAAVLDYTPIVAYAAGGRQADWRPRIRLVPAAIAAG
jgi:hypothetical protein